MVPPCLPITDGNRLPIVIVKMQRRDLSERGNSTLRTLSVIVTLLILLSVGCGSDEPMPRVQRLTATAIGGLNATQPPLTVTATPAQPAMLPAAWSGAYRATLAGMLTGADASVLEAGEPAQVARAVRDKQARLALTLPAAATGLASAEFDQIALALTVPFTFPLEEVTLAQARDLITGSVTEWRAAGGPAGQVSVSLGESITEPDLIRRVAGAAAAASKPGGLPLWIERGGPAAVTRKSLRVDGRLPEEEGYPLMERRVVAGRERERADVEALAAGLRAVLAAERPQTITLDAVGDIMLGRGVGQTIVARGVNYPFEAVQPVLAESDLRFGNLELPLTDRGTAARKDYVFRAPPAVAAGLRYGGFDLLSLANNHVLDYGVEGLLDTITALDRAGIAYTGAGRTPDEAYAPRLLTVKGIRIAVLAYLNVPNDSISGWVAQSFAALPGRPGVAWGTPEAVRRDVAAAKAQADLVLVSLHSGFEYTGSVNATQRSLARAAIDAGAALVLGGHPHVLQGVEFYQGVPVIYSLGNFIFDLDDDDRRQPGLPSVLSVIFRVTLDRSGVRSVRPLPVLIDQQDGRPAPVSGAEARPIYERLYRLTDALAAGG